MTDVILATRDMDVDELPVLRHTRVYDDPSQFPNPDLHLKVSILGAEIGLQPLGKRQRTPCVEVKQE